MNRHSTFRRVTQATTGAAFLLLGVLLAIGFGGLGQHGREVRWPLAGVVVLYGVIRIHGALSKHPDESQN